MIRPVSQKPLLFPSAVFVLGLCVAYALLPSSLAACALCIGFPEKTVADQLLAFHCALLARNTAENAFSYSPVLELKGEYDGSEIELLGDSRTRGLDGYCPASRIGMSCWFKKNVTASGPVWA